MRIRNVVIAAAVLTGAAVATHFYLGQRDAWNRRAEDALQFAAEERERAEAATEFADSVVADADARTPEIRERIIRVREDSPPDTARDAIIDDLLEVNSSLRLAVDSLSVANIRLFIANDSLTAVLEDRPLPRPVWLPEIRLGPQAGICMDGRFCAGIGVSIGWKLPI